MKLLSLLTGSILPFWKHLESALKDCVLKSDRRLKVVQVITAEDVPQHLVGVVLPEGVHDRVLSGIRHNGDPRSSAQGDGYSDMMHGSYSQHLMPL